RQDCQFHWQNRGYADFDAFLAGFSAAKRKKVRRERRRVTEAGIEIRWHRGGELDAADWRQIMPLYASSFWRRGREPYLRGDFFAEVAQAMPEQLLVVAARRHRELLGVAICFRDQEALYGRYWGSSGKHHSLHFETCYYQGIDYCIREGLQRFEPGTQGEHKIARGFAPVATWSLHWLSHPGFAAAVADYLQRERDYVLDYMDVVREHLPYRREHG
ncbi:MAG: GNAT family N-acetyltransferase, partial [Gammaproteobacteria bacterium]